MYFFALFLFSFQKIVYKSLSKEEEGFLRYTNELHLSWIRQCLNKYKAVIIRTIDIKIDTRYLINYS